MPGQSVAKNRLIENVEMGIVKEGGKITWINVTAAPIPLEDYGVAVAYGDITEHNGRRGIRSLARFPAKTRIPFYAFPRTG